MQDISVSYDVIIVGGNHHNGLGLARIFGINGLKVHACVVDDCIKSFLKYSKYVTSCDVFPNEKMAYDFILKTFIEENKYFIIPYSDGAAYELDKRLDEFKTYYVPSIGRKQGALAKMMHKSEQYEFAKESGIKMANTVIVDLKKELDDSVFALNFPCIVKPVISSEGEKRDIAICQNNDELKTALAIYQEKQYKRALVQEYLKIDYEIDVFGCIINQFPYICQIPTKTIRSWPPEGGTNSFSVIITEETVVSKCNDIIQKLADSGFYGLYDIELFVIGDDVYLNEINYRNSGDVYMGIAQGYYYPYAWVLDCLGMNVDIRKYPDKPEYTMTETADIRNVLKGCVGIKQWFRDFFMCKDYALRFRGDMKPAYNRYVYYVKQFIRGHRW